MDTSTLLPNPESVHVDHVSCADNLLTLTASVIAASAACPRCGHPASRFHSHYRRTLASRPWNGLRVQITLRSRKWYCDQPGCARVIFTERLPGIASRYARSTVAVAALWDSLAAALGGEGGSRLARQLAVPLSPDALLRRLRRAAPTQAPTPRVLGVDDFAFRRGRRYGTLLVDLERGVPLDLLPDRRAATLAQWLKEHPGVEIVSRDRASAYAEGIQQGAPTARQIADRWHLLQNLMGAFQEVLTQEQPQLRAALAATAGVATQQEEASVEPPPLRSSRQAEASTARRTRERQAYEQVQERAQRGMRQSDIARELGLSYGIVRKYVAAAEFPERRPRARAPGPLDPWISYLERRWEEGCRQPTQLWREIQSRGFSGKAASVYSYVTRRWGPILPSRLSGAFSPRTPFVPRCPPPQHLVWLLLAPADAASAQARTLQTHARSVPALAAAVTLAEEFFTMVRDRTVSALDEWLERARRSGLAAFRRFAAGLRLDQAAVQGGLEEPWSNGPVEGHVNRLKLLKRQMYGRASFALLRARVLAPTSAG